MFFFLTTKYTKGLEKMMFFRIIRGFRCSFIYIKTKYLYYLRNLCFSS